VIVFLVSSSWNDWEVSEEQEKARFQFRHDGKPVAQRLDAASGTEPLRKV
jgi:hypothetical protein